MTKNRLQVNEDKTDMIFYLTTERAKQRTLPFRNSPEWYWYQTLSNCAQPTCHSWLDFFSFKQHISNVCRTYLASLKMPQKLLSSPSYYLGWTTAMLFSPAAQNIFSTGLKRLKNFFLKRPLGSCTVLPNSIMWHFFYITYSSSRSKTRSILYSHHCGLNLRMVLALNIFFWASSTLHTSPTTSFFWWHTSSWNPILPHQILWTMFFFIPRPTYLGPATGYHIFSLACRSRHLSKRIF